MKITEQYTALYSRLSRDDELYHKGTSKVANESNSIRNQKKLLEDYAKKNGFTNTKHFSDDGWSGTNFERPNFMEMMKEVEKGRIGKICIKDMSRLGRDYLKVGRYSNKDGGFLPESSHS